MKIFIQGRKDGYNVLYPSPTPTEFYQFAYDIQKIDAQNDVRLYGQRFYSLAFTQGGYILSKYMIGYDDQRSNLGYIGISIFIPGTKKTTGENIKNLLDDLVNVYYKNYCPDFNIRNKQEDWILFNALVESFSGKLLDNSDFRNLISGTTDAAYIYYNEKTKIENFFDAPYQEEYQPYRQILFINKELENNPENPLNALRNSGVDLTGKIDLENPTYTIQYKSNTTDGVRVSVKANGALISNGNKFRRKNELEITWTKQYYKTQIQIGKCYEIAEKFILVNPDSRIVTIKEFELVPEELKIDFEIKDRAGNNINDAEILIENNLESKFKQQDWTKAGSANFQRLFKGGNIGIVWNVTARKGDNLISETHRIDFENDCNRNVELILNEKKVIEIKAFDEVNGNIIYDFDIWWQNSNGYKRTNKIEFKNDEIYKKWNITIHHKEYNPKEVTDFLPAENNTIEIKLNKKPIAQYPNPRIDGANKIDSKSNNKKKHPFFKNRSFILASIFLVLFISIGLFFILDKPQKTTPKYSISSYEIENYLEDDELLKDKLIEYRNNWGNLLVEQSNNQQDSSQNNIIKWYNPLTWFGSSEESNSSDTQGDILQNDSTMVRINRAIELRDSIKVLNFEYLKKQYYYERQNKFKKSIENLKKEDYKLIKDRLKDLLDNYTLDKIADSINTILDLKQTKRDAVKSQNEVIENPTASSDPIKKRSSQTSSTPSEVVYKNPTPKNNNTEIIQDLKGNELKIKDLKKIQTDNSSLGNSVKLYLDFWGKIKDSENKDDFNNLLKKIKVDKNLNESRLKSYLSKICENSQAFDKYYKEKIKRFRKTDNSTLNDLENLN